MRLAYSLALLLQIAAGPAAHPPPEPRYMRYRRTVQGTAKAGGQTCVVLDAAVLGHVANRGANDLRLYAGEGQGWSEVPFVLTESSAEPGDPETIPATNERVHGGVVDFDLKMPARPYSDIDLHVNGSDFIAVAEVTGSETQGSAGHSLGTVTIFDFSGSGSERLPRSTQLHLGESGFAWVHVRLQFSDVHGKTLSGGHAPGVSGASVPPSRQAQVLYDVVAQTSALRSQGTNSVAQMQVAAHVPVESVRFELDPRFTADFSREVTINASPRVGEATTSREPSGGEVETFHGTIGRVRRADPGPGMPAIRFEELAVPAAVGSNLRSDAEIRVSLANGGAPSLPVRSVKLEMRRRSLCFDAKAATPYMLFYGDEVLAAPVYNYARTFQPTSTPRMATLGPEERNTAHVARNSEWRARNPELFWVILLAVTTLIGATLVERMRRHKH